VSAAAAPEGAHAGAGARAHDHDPVAIWQREDTVAGFAERRRILIPLLELQEDVLAKLLTRGGRRVRRFLDLGAGTGAVSELVLRATAASSAASSAQRERDEQGVESHGVLVDFSEPMLARARAKLLASGAGSDGDARVQLVRGDLSSPAWREALPDGRYDAIVSGLAIHHLPSERKRALFAEALELLEPGGIFVNMDYVQVDGPLKGLFDEQMLANALAHAAQGEGEHPRQHEAPAEDDHGIAQQDPVGFDDEDEDRPDTLEDQLRWLRDAGFERVEVHFKWAEAAIYGGERAAGA
jgi:tRNA (cmo5U34)-methyltransferase